MIAKKPHSVVVLLALLAGPLTAFAQEGGPSSVLRRQSPPGVSIRTAQSLGSAAELLESAPTPPNLLSNAAAEGLPMEVGPPPIMDPAPIDSGAVLSTPPTAYTAQPAPEVAYPIMPPATAVSPAPAVSYGTPVSQAVGSSQTMGCSGGCDGGCASVGCAAAPGCGAPTIGCSGGCSGGCGGACGGGHWIDSLALNVGVLGFKNAVNTGESGSFGFQQGANWATPWICSALGFSSQIGFRATQSDFNGSDFTAQRRHQYFVTAGFYKRNYSGWQGGFVFDYLHDDWYAAIDVGQIRGELSYGVPSGSAFGFWFTTSVMSDETTSVFSGATVNQRWDTHDIYSVFYRVQSNRFRRGQWRVFAGFTGASDGIVGADWKIPIAGSWSMEPEFTYLIPDEETGFGGHDQEAWNVAFNLVWYPGQSRGVAGSTPLFDVAGNGNMITRLQSQN